jgi:hypothetical protein
MSAFDNAFAEDAFDVGCTAGAFDGAFDDDAFDGCGVGSAGERYAVLLPIKVVSSDVRVFDSSIGRVLWSVIAVVGGVDVSHQLSGELKIAAVEDGARAAWLELSPLTPGQFEALDSAPITIDVTVNGGGYLATRRRFTGVVRRVEFDAAHRVARLECRDRYQETIRAAGSASAVQALLGGLPTISDKVVAWDDATPDPVGYFRGLLGTVAGATYIDGSGQWRVVKWDIGAPAISYGTTDVFSDGLSLIRPTREDMPASVVATLTHEYYRLHNAELGLSWEGPAYVNYVTRGIPHASKAMVVDALAGLGDWVVRGEPVLVSPTPGNYPVWANGQTAFYTVRHDLAPSQIDELQATVYRRWYQQVTRRYTVTVEVGGSSDRDESINRQIKSQFDADGWESGRRSEPSLGIYSKNPPIGSEDEEVPTGYEALSAPWPPANATVDHFGDLAAPDVIAAVRFVIAEAARLVAAGRRQQRLRVERPVDLRVEIGGVGGIDAYGLSGIGQAVEYEEFFDFVGGLCVGTYVFSCPAGNGDETGADAVVAIPAPAVAHALAAPGLGNWIGGDSNTPRGWIPPDTIAGYLCNTLSDPERLLESSFYDPDAPHYETQFRIVLPEISAAHRDPVTETVPVAADIHVAGAGVSVSFED